MADEEINTLVNLATAVGLLGARAVLIGVSGPLSLKLQSSSFEVRGLVDSRELAGAQRASLRP